MCIFGSSSHRIAAPMFQLQDIGQKINVRRCCTLYAQIPQLDLHTIHEHGVNRQTLHRTCHRIAHIPIADKITSPPSPGTTSPVMRAESHQSKKQPAHAASCKSQPSAFFDLLLVIRSLCSFPPHQAFSPKCTSSRAANLMQPADLPMYWKLLRADSAIGNNTLENPPQKYRERKVLSIIMQAGSSSRENFGVGNQVSSSSSFMVRYGICIDHSAPPPLPFFSFLASPPTSGSRPPPPPANTNGSFPTGPQLRK
ncbi:hypothetical protein K402DRAFT_235896 [Aulographum hederae CBS 113979]|uniref:Uncharacterized protein n=1 Tax=Aulographum hederae CBS 113979 TaxID=1176131 RepID=A0A6G1GKI5_9PEZI|nr:hypothetical protein K402DRAFT_235896 [Aulographum hederae CBS 113979]